jgi:hypothetical protein
MATQQKITMHCSKRNSRSMVLALVGIGFMVPLLFAQNVAAESAQRGVETQTADLHPFTHFASIPASSDPETIKFEQVKARKVFTGLKSTRDPRYCNNVQFNEPSGSMYCPLLQHESPATAYEVTYSFKGEPLASDEYGNRNFTFQVYFRPEELPSTLQSAISARKVHGTELATYFNVTTSRALVHGSVSDEANSSFCAGHFVDVEWVQNDPRCQDKVSLKNVTTSSDSITVQVEPISQRPQEEVASR